jgi:hypothetical protein
MPWYAYIGVAVLAWAITVALLLMIGKAINLRDRGGK